MCALDSTHMIAAVFNLLSLYYIGYYLAEHLFATRVENVWFSAHSDHVSHDVAADCVVNFVWHYVCTNNLGLADYFAAASLL